MLATANQPSSVVLLPCGTHGTSEQPARLSVCGGRCSRGSRGDHVCKRSSLGTASTWTPGSPRRDAPSQWRPVRSLAESPTASDEGCSTPGCRTNGVPTRHPRRGRASATQPFGGRVAALAHLLAPKRTEDRALASPRPGLLSLPKASIRPARGHGPSARSGRGQRGESRLSTESVVVPFGHVSRRLYHSRR